MSTLLRSNSFAIGREIMKSSRLTTRFALGTKFKLGQTNRDGYSTWDMSYPAQNEDRYRLISLFTPVAGFEEKALLQASIGRERFFWSEPNNNEGSLTIVGVGIAAELRVAPVLDIEEYTAQLPGHRFQAIHEQADRLFSKGLTLSIDDPLYPEGIADYSSHPARPRLIGGFAFQDDFIPDNTWSVFNPSHFVLPHFQWTRCAGETFLTINALVPSNEKPDETISSLREALLARIAFIESSQVRPNHAVDRRYPMTLDRWREIVGHALTEINSGNMVKVVLSRVCEVVTHDSIDVSEALAYLNNDYGDCYRFIFEPVPYHAFFGATPELLVEKHDSIVKTMALAGSTGRGSTPAEDAEKAADLLTSVKNIHEHRLVIDAITNQLAPITSEISQPVYPDILRLRNIQHLLTPITGRLKDGTVGILHLARLLHPTPAMGGVPVERALLFLRRAEPVPRGWYAAPIGWIDGHHNGTFAVAIRSAVTQHNRAWLYAGAGIVDSSEPDHEWTETALKFRPMLGAFGIE